MPYQRSAQLSPLGLLLATLVACSPLPPDDTELTTTGGRKADTDGSSASGGTGGQSSDTGGTSSGGRDGTGTGGTATRTRLKIEAEAATLKNDANVAKDPVASGGSYVALSGAGEVHFTLNFGQPGDFDLVLSAGTGKAEVERESELYVNGKRIGAVVTQDRAGSGTFYEHAPIRVTLAEGDNDIVLRSSGAALEVDYLSGAIKDTHPLTVKPTLVNPQATLEAKRLMHLLVDLYGGGILAGQQGIDWADTVHSLTGKRPAVVGFDMMDYSPSRLFGSPPPEEGETERAIAWWKEHGGIVTFVWHWNAPTDLRDMVWDDGNGNIIDASWYKGFYTYATTFNVEAALKDPQSANYKLILRDIDAIAVQLKKLSDANVPVLWRPLHEASGGWFWWGARGAKPYLQLWNLLYDRLTNVHNLHNLIWVWNGQHVGWYPGDERADIIGEDVYGEKRNYVPQTSRFNTALNYTTTPKMVTMSENGSLVDPDLLVQSRAYWSWFTLWSGAEYVMTEEWNELSMLRKVYDSEYVLTLDEIPDVRTYPAD
jgi:mannan endo-1,4-beta-mannosidase